MAPVYTKKTGRPKATRLYHIYKVLLNRLRQHVWLAQSRLDDLDGLSGRHALNPRLNPAREGGHNIIFLGRIETEVNNLRALGTETVG